MTFTLPALFTPLLSLLGMGIGIGALLGFTARRFHVEGDPVIEQINDLLPQTQCGQCGYPGCRPYAEAIAAGDAINKCPPGGEQTITDLASLLNVSERQMERSFHDILNMPPKSWLREQRMVYARELFERGMHKREVASITGFKSYSHFAAEVAHFFSKKPKDLERCNGKRSQVLLKQLG